MFTLLLLIAATYGGWQLNNYTKNMNTSTRKAITGRINDKLDAVKAKIGGVGK